MGLIYRKKYQVKENQVDQLNRMKISDLTNVLIETSGEQTDTLYPSRDLLRDGLTWFVVQHDLSIMRLPKINEVIDIETEAISYNQFFTYRRFSVYVENQEILSTLMRFSVVDQKERKIVRIEDKFIEKYMADKGRKHPDLEKIKVVDWQEAKHLRNQVVKETDIDLNGHVNNAIYFDWLFTAIGESFLEKHNPEKISIIYDKEVVLGDTVTIFENTSLEEASIYSIKNKTDNVCRAKIVWRKR